MTSLVCMLTASLALMPSQSVSCTFVHICLVVAEIPYFVAHVTLPNSPTRLRNPSSCDSADVITVLASTTLLSGEPFQVHSLHVCHAVQRHTDCRQLDSNISGLIGTWLVCA